VSRVVPHVSVIVVVAKHRGGDVCVGCKQVGPLNRGEAEGLLSGSRVHGAGD